MFVAQKYKQTELGAVPEDWQLVPIISLIQPGTTITYGVVQPGHHVDNGVLFIRGGDIFAGKIIESQLRTISLAVSTQYARTRLRGGELLVSLVGYPGEAAIVPQRLAGANIARQVAIIRFNPVSDVVPAFVCHFLQSAIGRRQLLNEAIGSAQKVINLRDIKKVTILLTTKAEQEAIAGALGDADGLIESLEKLIAKKRQIKQAAMQQLLTGEKRLPGFSGEWCRKRLSDGITLLSGHHILAGDCNSDGRGVPYITGPADFPDGVIVHSKFTVAPKTICEAGDILVTVKGSGVGSMVVANGRYCISRQLMAVRVSRNWDAQFIFYSLLQNSPFFATTATGLIPGISRSDLLDTLLPLPTQSEQVGIASCLSDMDAELTALEAKLAKARKIKQGMMHNLLTGRIRLV
jgi:type I restriction enzyme S subunit